MIKLFVFIVLSSSLYSASCQHRNEDLYNENDYVEDHRGLIDGLYQIVYYYKKDTNYRIKKFYADSLYQDSSFIFSKYFFHKDVMEGPAEHYSDGELYMKGFMKGNKRHGEFLLYDKGGKLDQRQFYDMGREVGVWEDYYSTTGILFKKVYYDKGKFLKQEIYDRKESGKLLRTEYQESEHY